MIKSNVNTNKMRFTIMYPVWVFTGLMLVYIYLTLKLPTCIDRHEQLCRGYSFLFNYISIFYMVCARFKLLDVVKQYIPPVMPGFAVKFVQIVMYMAVFRVKKIYYVNLIILFLFEILMSLYVLYDASNIKYTREKDVTD